MFQHGAGGETTVNMASNQLAIKRVRSHLCDISGPTWGDAAAALTTDVLFSAEDGPKGIAWVHVIYARTGGGAAGALDIGYTNGTGGTTDADAIVDAHATSTTAVLGDIETCTLADMLRGTTQMSGGLPIIPQGFTVYATATQGAGNTGDFFVEIGYFDIEPGQ